MVTLEELNKAGYVLTYNSRRYDVEHRGKRIGGGGREDYHNGTPFDTTNWTSIHKMCAQWVAERHYLAENPARAAREKLAEGVLGGRQDESGCPAGIERGVGNKVRFVPPLALGTW